MAPGSALPRDGSITKRRIHALVAAAGHVLASDFPETSPDNLHWFDKADTRAGLVSLQALSNLGVPYSVLLYERFLAGHLRVIGIQ